MPDFPLTDLIVALMRHPNLNKACPDKAAKKFGIRPDIARYYLDQEKARRRSKGIPWQQPRE